MSQPLSKLHGQARAMLSEYVFKYPDELGGLASLTQQLDRNDPELFARSNMAGHITASGVVLNADRTKTLVIHHVGLGLWLQPGGHVDDTDKSIRSAAAREVLEETGVAMSQPILLDIDSHAVPANERKREGAHVHHDFAFLAFADETALTPQLAEVHAARWLTFEELTRLEGRRMQRFVRKLRPLMHP